ncbi:Uma2 family endonuclease [Streptacidiphilus sp. PAMC 29251]
MTYADDEDREILRLWNELELPSGAWAELLDSQIVLQPHPTHLHDVPGRVFVRTVPEPFEAFSERGVGIGPSDQPRPDVAIALATDIPEDVRDWPASVVLAVVETVSAGRGAARRDYETKRDAYQRAGIPVYVIVDPRDATWLVLLLTDGVYEEHAKGAFGQPIPLPSPLGFPVPTVAFHPYPALAGGPAGATAGPAPRCSCPCGGGGRAWRVRCRRGPRRRCGDGHRHVPWTGRSRRR